MAEAQGLVRCCPCMHACYWSMHFQPAIFRMLYGYTLRFCVCFLMGYAMLSIYIAGLRRHPRQAPYLLPGILLLSFLLPSQPPFARWLVAGGAFVIFLSAFKLYVLDRHDERLQVELCKEPFEQHFRRYIPLQISPTPHRGSAVLRRTARAGLRMMAANALLLEHVACTRSPPANPLTAVLADLTLGFGFYSYVEFINDVLMMPQTAQGFEIEDVFQRPYLATSLPVFWGKRWNVYITKLFKRTVYVPLGGHCRYVAASAAVFLASAIFHEYANFFGGIALFHNSVFFCMMWAATALHKIAAAYLATQWPETPVARATAAVAGWATTMAVLWAAAPWFFQPYITAGLFEEQLRLLPYHSLDVYPLPLAICPGQM